MRGEVAPNSIRVHETCVTLMVAGQKIIANPRDNQPEVGNSEVIATMLVLRSVATALSLCSAQDVQKIEEAEQKEEEKWIY